MAIVAQEAQSSTLYLQPEGAGSNNSLKRSYVQVDLKNREDLIDLVETQGMTIKDAAKRLLINYSTAKHIVKVFKKTGDTETVLMKRRRHKTAAVGVHSDQHDEPTGLSACS